MLKILEKSAFVIKGCAIVQHCCNDD